MSSQTFQHTHTHAHTHFMKKHCVIPDTDFMASPPPSRPLFRVFLLFIKTLLLFYLRTSCLHVSNSNQSTGKRGGGGEKTRRTHHWVCPPRQTLALAPHSSSPPGWNGLGTFLALLTLCHQGNITSHGTLIDKELIFIHLSAVRSRKL